jgi:hypothetical protein
MVSKGRGVLQSFNDEPAVSYCFYSEITALDGNVFMTLIGKFIY